MAGGAIALAGCFGDDETENGNDDGTEESDTGEESGDDSTDEDAPEEDSEDEEPQVLEIPEPVDWTDEPQATIEVGPGGETVFEPDAVRVETGTTLRWVWMSDGHTLVPTHQPGGGGFEGTTSVEDGGFEFEFVPETPGEYRYVCEEHEEMVGYLVVE